MKRENDLGRSLKRRRDQPQKCEVRAGQDN